MEPIEQTEVRQKSLPANVKLLGIASLLNDIASEAIYPLMPQFLISVLGGNRFHLGLIEGFADSVASLLKLWSGAKSDKLGQRRTFVVAGYSLTVAIRPLIGIVTAPWQLFAARIVDRIGKGLRTAPRDALIADSSAPEQHGRSFGFHRAMDHLGAAIGPLLSMAFLLLWPDQLRTLFLLTLIPGLVVVVVLYFGLKEKAAHSKGTSAPPASDGKLNRNFKVYLAALAIFTLGNSSDAFLLVRAGELGVPTALLPLLWSLFHIVKSLGTLMAGRLADRVGPRPLIAGGWILYAIVYLAFGFMTNATQAWIAFLFYAVFYSVTEPAEKKLVAQLVPADQSGRAFGWFSFAIGIAALPASVIFGWIYEHHGAVASFGWGAGLALVSVGLLSRVKHGSC